MGKLDSVQYLRAVAALLVTVAHSFSYQMGAGNLYVFLGGQFGVQLFFVISGFIMVYISGSGPFPAGQFLLRRAIRIMPLYWLFTILAAALALVAPSLFKTTVFTWPHFIQSLFFIVHEAPGRGGSSPLLSQGWTLNYEAYFYLCFAVLAFLAARGRVAALAVAFLCLWALGLVLRPSNPVLQFYLSISPLGFVFGCLVGLWVTARRMAPMPHPSLLLAMTCVGIYLAIIEARPPIDAPLSIFGQHLTGVSLLLLGLRLEARIRRLPIWKLIGDASYAIYLSHIFTIGAVVVATERLIDTDRPIAMVVMAMAASTLATLVGVGVHEIIEKRLLRIFKGLDQLFFKQPQVRDATAD